MLAQGCCLTMWQPLHWANVWQSHDTAKPKALTLRLCVQLQGSKSAQHAPGTEPSSLGALMAAAEAEDSAESTASTPEPASSGALLYHAAPGACCLCESNQPAALTFCKHASALVAAGQLQTAHILSTALVQVQASSRHPQRRHGRPRQSARCP